MFSRDFQLDPLAKGTKQMSEKSGGQSQVSQKKMIEGGSFGSKEIATHHGCEFFVHLLQGKHFSPHQKKKGETVKMGETSPRIHATFKV